VSDAAHAPGPDGGGWLEVRRTIHASADFLFAAWTQPETLLVWWGPPGVRCIAAEVDLREGGRYRLGNLLPDGTTVWITGRFERVVGGRELVYSWHVERAGAAPGPPELVTVRFVPVEGSVPTTQIVVIHERIPDEPTRSSHRVGWEGCLDALGHLTRADAARRR
jgi:uncharacterized protein YndB with AHSA1/START domain